jgi:peptide subunit release factor RF-3
MTLGISKLEITEGEIMSFKGIPSFSPEFPIHQ